MAPKKGKKIDLNDFALETGAGGSWADVDDVLPVVPAALSSGDVQLPTGPGAGRGAMGGMLGRGSSRPELPIPKRPPYTASVNNLSYDVKESDLREFFEALLIKDIRIASSDGRPKGFAFVEFETPEDLKEALKRSGTDCLGRIAFVHVAADKGAESEGSWVRRGPLGAPEGGFGSRRISEGGSWERQGPLPPPEGRGGFGAGPGASWERKGPITGAGPGAEGRSGASSLGAGPVSWERKGPLPTSGGPQSGPSSRAASGGSWERKGPIAPEGGSSRAASFGSGGTWERKGPVTPPASRGPSRSGSRLASGGGSWERKGPLQ